MLSRKQKAIYLTGGGAVAAALVWLCNAKSAAGARSFLGEAGKKVGNSLSDIQNTLSTVRQCTEEVDRFVHELVQVGRERRAQAVVVIDDTLKRLEQTTDVIQKNLTQSSEEITALLRDIRIAVAHLVSSQPSQAA
jgi:uncharacterized membrane protein